MESEDIKSCFVNKMDYSQLAPIILSSCIKEHQGGASKADNRETSVRMQTCFGYQETCFGCQTTLRCSPRFAPPPDAGNAHEMKKMVLVSDHQVLGAAAQRENGLH